VTGSQPSRQAATAGGGRAGDASAKARGQEKTRQDSEKVDSEGERRVIWDLSLKAASLCCCVVTTEQRGGCEGEPQAERGRRLRGRQEKCSQR